MLNLRQNTALSLQEFGSDCVFTWGMQAGMKRTRLVFLPRIKACKCTDFKTVHAPGNIFYSCYFSVANSRGSQCLAGVHLRHWDDLEMGLSEHIMCVCTFKCTQKGREDKHFNVSGRLRWVSSQQVKNPHTLTQKGATTCLTRCCCPAVCFKLKQHPVFLHLQSDSAGPNHSLRPFGFFCSNHLVTPTAQQFPIHTNTHTIYTHTYTQIVCLPLLHI